jgi:hypothetical protein
LEPEKKQMRETWYVLEDGSVVDPNECAPDEAGRLVHKSSAAVAMRGHVPSTRGVDPEEERAKAATTDADKAAAKKSAHATAKQKAAENTPPEEQEETQTKDLTAEDSKRTYKTRDSKAD